MVQFRSHPYSISGHLDDFCRLINENVGKGIGFLTYDKGDYCGQIVGVYKDNKFGVFLIVGDEKIDVYNIVKKYTTVDVAGRIPAEGNYPRSKILDEANPSQAGFQDRVHQLVYERFNLKPFSDSNCRNSNLPALPAVSYEDLKLFCDNIRPGDRPVIILNDKREIKFVSAQLDQSLNKAQIRTTEGEVSVDIADIEDFVCLV